MAISRQFESEPLPLHALIMDAEVSALSKSSTLSDFLENP